MHPKIVDVLADSIEHITDLIKVLAERQADLAVQIGVVRARMDELELRINESTLLEFKQEHDQIMAAIEEMKDA